LTQAQVTVQGHAIEARICAETPDHDFLPAIGRLHVIQIPQASRFSVSAVRFDSGVREGDSISPYYDSMIAKLIVHGDTREQALARLDQALAQLHIVGVQNNVAFIRHVIRTDSFAKAHLDTGLIEREKALLFHLQSLPVPHALAAAVAADNSRAEAIFISGATSQHQQPSFNGIFDPTGEKSLDGRVLYKHRSVSDIWIEHVNGDWSILHESWKGTERSFAYFHGGCAFEACKEKIMSY
jgi:acetyl/propionyl-CoA carboxylase alpha subunit